MVTAVETRVDTLRSLGEQIGGARLLDQATSDLALITSLLDHGRYPSALPSTAASYLYLRQAEALARDTQHEAAGTSLNRACDLWGTRREGDRPDRIGWYGEAQLKSTEGKIMLRSGFPERAASDLRVAMDQAVLRVGTVRSGRLATARLAAQDLDGALDAVHVGPELLENPVPPTGHTFG
jgi:hypothetical protein